MMNDLRYVSYSKKYASSTISLLNTVFPDKCITEQSFYWKHFDQYFQGKTKAMVALQGEMVCSFVCFTPSFVACKQHTIPFYSCAIQATHPDYRRRGIVSDLTKLIEAQIPTSEYFGFSNEDGVNIDRYSKRIGYHILGRLRRYYSLSFPHRSSVGIQEVQSIQSLPFWDRNSSLFQFRYDRKYLCWRYAEDPKHRYTNLVFVHQGKQIGYAIVRMNKWVNSVYVLHLTDYSFFYDCIRALSHFGLMNKKICTSYVFLPNAFIQKHRSVFDFTKKEYIFFTVQSKIMDILDKDNWLIQLGDIQ